MQSPATLPLSKWPLRQMTAGRICVAFQFRLTKEKDPAILHAHGGGSTVPVIMYLQPMQPRCGLGVASAPLILLCLLSATACIEVCHFAPRVPAARPLPTLGRLVIAIDHGGRDDDLDIDNLKRSEPAFWLRPVPSQPFRLKLLLLSNLTRPTRAPFSTSFRAAGPGIYLASSAHLSRSTHLPTLRRWRLRKTRRESRQC